MGINASTIQKLYIAYFNRPADVAGLTYWEGQLDANKISLAGLAQSFSEQVEYKNVYGGKTSSEVIGTLYKNLFARAADADGLIYWAGQIDSGKVNMGTAALAILSGASAGSQDGKTIQNKLNFATDFTNSLNTEAKIANYSSAAEFDVMKLTLASITVDTVPGQLVLNKAIIIKEAASGINALEKAAGMEVLVDLSGVQAVAGYQLELMNGSNAFSSPIVYTLNVTDVLNQKASIKIPEGTDWGGDGNKTLGIRIVDLKGNIGKIAGQLTVQLDTTPPVTPTAVSMDLAYAQTTASAGNYNTVTETLHISLPVGQATNGKASLQLAGVTIATIESINSSTTSLDFSFDVATGKRVFDGLNTDKSLSLVITDAAGNRVQSNLAELPSTITHQKVEAANNIKIVPVGGTVVSNTLNSSNTNLLVEADVNAKIPLNGAELLLNGQVIAKASADQISQGKIYFDLHSSSNTNLQALVANSGFVSVRVWDYFGDSASSAASQPLSVRYEAIVTGNPNTAASTTTTSTTTTLTAPDNIRITPVGGNISSNALNASNIDLVIDANIVAGQAVGGKAELKIGSRVIAVDNAINASKNSLHFDLGTSTSAALQSMINAGGVVSIVLSNAAGQTVSSSNNPLLAVDYTPLAIATPLSIAAAANGLNAQEVAGAVNVQVDLSGVQGAQTYSIELLKDGSSFSTPVIHAITSAEASAGSASFAIPAGVAWGPDGSKQLSVKLTNLSTQVSKITASNNVVVDTTPPGPLSTVTYVRPATYGASWDVEISIPAGQMAGGKAVLFGNSTYTDNIISASDTKVSFTIPQTELAHASFNNGLDFSLFDAAGNLTTGNIYRLAQVYINAGNPVLNAPGNIKFYPVGGTIVADTINATNTSVRVVADITPGQAAGGEASLLLFGGSDHVYVYDKQILPGDTTVTFDVATDSAFALKALLGGTAELTARVTLTDINHTSVEALTRPILKTAYVNGEAIVGGLTAPSVISLTVLGGNITPVQGNVVTLNGSNVGFKVEAAITPGQAANGRAELWVGNKLIMTANPLNILENHISFSSFSIPESGLTPSFLQSTLQTGGELVIKLYDHAEHLVTSLPGTMTIVTNYASMTGMQGPQNNASLIGIVGQPVPELLVSDLYSI